MLAKEQWLTGNINDARGSLISAYEHNLTTSDKHAAESIALAAVKLESEAGVAQAAVKLLARFRQEVNTPKVWMKSALHDRKHGRLDEALDLLNEAIPRFPGPTFTDRRDKLHMIKGQILTNRQNISAARDTYRQAIKTFPQSVVLRLLASRLEETAGLRIRSRALLEQARTAIPKNVELYLESAKVELRADTPTQAKAIIARAIQECPPEECGALWDLSIWLEPRAVRRKLTVDAIKKVGTASPILLTTSARMFWQDSKVDKARDWFTKAVKADTDYGDTWAWWYAFEREHGSQVSRRLSA